MQALDINEEQKLLVKIQQLQAISSVANNALPVALAVYGDEDDEVVRQVKSMQMRTFFELRKLLSRAPSFEVLTRSIWNDVAPSEDTAGQTKEAADS